MRLASLAGLFLVFAPSAFATTILVPSPSAPTITDGLSLAVEGDSVIVACGAYTEDQIAMKSGVVLRSESGDPSCVELRALPSSGVMTCIASAPSTTVEGITLRGSHVYGAFVSGGAPVFRNCFFLNNRAYEYGGGVRSIDAAPSFFNCTFRDNDGERGGGLYAFGGSPTLQSCTFESNSGGPGSAAVHCVAATPTIDDCMFFRNQGWEGVGLFLDSVGSATISRCTFQENIGREGGGAAILNSSATFDRCVFRDNEVTADPYEQGTLGRGGAIYSRGSGTTQVIRCNFFGGSATRGAVAAAVVGHQIEMSQCIISGMGAGLFFKNGLGGISVACSNFSENYGGLSGLADLTVDVQDCFSADPAHCDPDLGNYGLRENSMCAPSRSPCGEIVGAFSVSCEARGVYLATLPPGLLIEGNGLQRRDSAWFDWSIGTSHSVSALSPQVTPGNVRRTFASWDDGGAQTHSILVESTDDVFTAIYDETFLLDVQVQGQGTTEPSSPSWRNPGETVAISATPGVGWIFNRWIGGGVGSYGGTDVATTVTMNEPLLQIAEFLPAVGVTFESDPPGRVVRVDGVAHTTPFTLQVPEGTSHVADVDSLLDVAPGYRQRFLAWSSGNTAQILIEVGAEPLSFTATFQTECELTFEPTNLGQLLPGDAWVAAGDTVVIEAVPDFGSVFQGWIGTGAGSFTGPDNPVQVTMLGPIHEEATFGPAFVGAGYEFSISASDTDPFMNAVASSGSPRLVYLWLTCSQRGLSAMEFGVNTTLPVFGFEPNANVLNLGTATSLQLAIGGCPTGDPASIRLGRWLIDDTGGTFCVGPSDGEVFGAVDCHPIDPQLWLDPRVTGFASDGSEPCVVGTNGATDPPPTAVVVTPPPSMPLATMLHGAFPNPVVGQAQVRFSLDQSRQVRLTMYDVAGRLVEHLVDAALPSGEHAVRWDANKHGRRLPGGIYFLRLSAAGESWSKKMMLVTPKRAP